MSNNNMNPHTDIVSRYILLALGADFAKGDISISCGETLAIQLAVFEHFCQVLGSQR